MKNLIRMFHVKLIIFFIFLIPRVGRAQHFGTTTLAVKNLPSLPARIDSIDWFLNKSTFFTPLNSNQKEWFYWTNYSRNNPKMFWDSVILPILKVYPSFRNGYTNSLENDLTAAKPLPLLYPNPKLLSTSHSLAKELAASNASPSHTSPSGVTFQERMRSAGIVNCAGENISYGPQNPVLMLVLLYIDNGVPQLGHRKSLLNPSFTQMGIGIETYADKNSIVIQDFGCAQP